jgi:hypothetical protein
MSTYYSGNLTDNDLQEMHDDLIDEIYPPVTIGIYEWAPSRVLKVMDPVAYRISVVEYVDQLIEDGQLEELN